MNSQTSRSSSISSDEKIKKEMELLPLKDKLANLDYELAKIEGRVTDLKIGKYITR